MMFTKCLKCGWHSSFPLRRKCPRCGDELQTIEDAFLPGVVFTTLISLSLATFLLSIYLLKRGGPEVAHGAALLFISPSLLLYALAYRMQRAEKALKE